MLCVSHEVSPLPRGLGISPEALENTKMPSLSDNGCIQNPGGVRPVWAGAAGKASAGQAEWGPGC